MKTTSVVFLSIALTLMLSGPARATLTTIGQAFYDGGSYNLIYDNDGPSGSIVWLDYSNSGNWYEHMDWAMSLNNAGVISYTLKSGYKVDWEGEWHLSDNYTNASGLVTYCDLGHLYFNEFGNIPFMTAMEDTGDFRNLQRTEYASRKLVSWVSEYDSYMFYDMSCGYQDVFYLDTVSLGLAVRSANVEITIVPEPSTLLLTGGGLAGLAFLRRRKSR